MQLAGFITALREWVPVRAKRLPLGFITLAHAHYVKAYADTRTVLVDVLRWPLIRVAIMRGGARHRSRVTLQEVMEQPVVLADGFTYERAEIMRWLQAHATSPMTGEVLANRIIVSNTALRSVIRIVMGRT